jgi:hypothetical protein
MIQLFLKGDTESNMVCDTSEDKDTASAEGNGASRRSTQSLYDPGASSLKI